MFMLLSVREHGKPERFFPLRSSNTYTMSRGVGADVTIGDEGVADPHVQIRYDGTTGKFLIKCLVKVTPLEESGLYLLSEDHGMVGMVGVTEATLEHGSDFAFGRHVSFTVLDPALLTKQRDDLKERLDSVQIELWRAQADIKDLERELGASQIRRQSAEEELRVLREEGGSSKRRK